MVNSVKCPFCEELRRVKHIDQAIAESDTRSGKTLIKYRVSLVHELYYNDFFTGQTVGKSMELKRCPVCGVDIDSTELSFGKE